MNFKFQTSNMKYCPLHLINTKCCQICACWQSQWRLGEEKHSSSIEKSVRQAASNVSSTLKESVQTFGDQGCKLGWLTNKNQLNGRTCSKIPTKTNKNLRKKKNILIKHQQCRWEKRHSSLEIKMIFIIFKFIQIFTIILNHQGGH